MATQQELNDALSGMYGYLGLKYLSHEDLESDIAAQISGLGLDQDVEDQINSYFQTQQPLQPMFGQNEQQAIQQTIVDATFGGGAAYLKQLSSYYSFVGQSVIANALPDKILGEAIETSLTTYGMPANQTFAKVDQLAKGIGGAALLLGLGYAAHQIYISDNPSAEGIKQGSLLGTGLVVAEIAAAGLIAATGAPIFAGAIFGAVIAGGVVYALDRKWGDILDFVVDAKNNSVPLADAIEDAIAEFGADVQGFLDDPGAAVEDMVDDGLGLLDDLQDALPILLNELPSWAPDVLNPFDEAYGQTSPIILDLDADGIEVTTFNAATTTTFFDLNNDGFAEQTAWAGDDDGLLARDVNENGKIDNVSELFGSVTVDGFALLQELDSNDDLVIDQYDDAWSELLIWKDVNGDAVSQESELHTLDYYSIASISLAGIQAGGQTLNGNTVSHKTTFKFENGSTGAAWDVWFTHDTMNTVNVAEYTLDADTLFLPTLRGFGRLPDLHIAMSQDEDLLELVQDLASGFSFASFADYDALNSAVEDILYKWAGVESVDPESRSQYMDARQLEFVEELVGEDWNQVGHQGHYPGAGASALLQQSWDKAFHVLKGQLLVQMGVQNLFGGTVSYDPVSGEFVGDLELDQQAIDGLVAFATAGGVDAEDYWLAIADALHAIKDLYNLTVQEEGWLDDAVQESDENLTWEEIEDAYYALTQDPDGQTINGTSGNDTLTGSVYDDTITALAGNDAIEGREGDDVIYGGDGNDTIEGQEGDDEIYGEAGDDVLKPGGGGNFVYGYSGDDQYIYGGGDDVYANYTGNDTIILPSGITLNDLTFWRTDFDLHIAVGNLGSIQIEEQYFASGWIFPAQIQKIVFADTSEFNLTTLASFPTYGTDAAETINGVALITVNETIYGLGGDDVLDGNDGNDVLDGGLGNDTLYGDDGDDTYVFSPGFDLILEGGGTDTILIPVGYDASDLSFFRSTSAEDALTLTVTGLGQMQNPAQFHWNSSYAFEYIAFASGGSPIAMSTYSVETIGTSANNTLNGVTAGASTNDILNGMGGDDTLYGDAGNDTYIFSEGDDYAYDTSGTETLKFRNDYLLEDVVIYRMNAGGGGQPANDLMIEDAFGNSIKFIDHFNASAASPMTTALEQLVFSDNSTVSVYSLEIETRGTSGDDQLYEVFYGDASDTDTIYAYGGNDQVNGGAGNDFIDGGDGIDTLDGGDGNDVVYGGSGNDTVMGGATDNGNDTVYGDAGDDYVYGYGGADILYGGAGSDTINGGADTDTVNYSLDPAAVIVNLTTGSATDGYGNTDTLSGIEKVIGSAYNDTITGSTGNDELDGAAGNDTISGAAGDDILIGGSGTDALTYASAGAAITLNLATATSQNTGGAGSDTISGFENLVGSAFNDTLTGDANANVIEGLAGNDTINGAGGTDTLTYASAGAGVTVNLATTTGQNTVGAGTDTLSNFENLTGSAFNDTLTGTSGANVIEGLAGNDTLNGAGGTDLLTYASAGAGVTVNLATTTAQNTGGAGTDTISNFENLTGSAFNDTLTGTSGNNVIEGGAGNDTMNGQGGTDTLTYANASGAITLNLATATAQNTGGAGTDTVSNFENLTGSAFDDVLTGNTAANTINGGDGNDTIQGGAGNDTLTGGNGTDTASYSSAASAVTVNLATTTGQNTVGAGTDTISGIENLTGSAFNDTLTGDGNANVIRGEAGNDTINGGGGNDFLYGAAGTDTLTGSTGGDVFLFESASAFSNVDTIADFSAGAGDKIDLHDVIDLEFDPLTEAISDFVNFTNSGGNSIMSVDRDGTGTTYAFTDVATLTGLTNQDEVALYSSGNLLAA